MKAYTSLIIDGILTVAAFAILMIAVVALESRRNASTGRTWRNGCFTALAAVSLSACGFGLFWFTLDLGMPEWLAYVPVIAASLLLGRLIRRSLVSGAELMVHTDNRITPQ